MKKGLTGEMPIQDWEVTNFDGRQYELRNVTLSRKAQKLGFESTQNGEQQALALLGFGGIQSTTPIVCSMVWADCDAPLEIGVTYKGKLSGNPKKLASKGRYPKLIVVEKGES